MVAGAVVAGATDLTYSLPGYIWVSICAVSTAAYLLLIRKLSDRTGMHWDQVHDSVEHIAGRAMWSERVFCAGLTQAGLLFYNNVLALPMMAGYMLLATNEAQQALRLPQITQPHFLVRCPPLPFSHSSKWHLDGLCNTGNVA